MRRQRILGPSGRAPKWHSAAAAGVLAALIFGAAASARERPAYYERAYKTAEELHELYKQLEAADTLFMLDSVDDAIVGGGCREEHLFYSEALAEVQKLAARKRAGESLTYDEERYYEDQHRAEERLWNEFEDCYNGQLRLPTFQNDLPPGIDSYLDAVTTYDWLRAEHGWQQDAGFDVVKAEIEREIEELESEPAYIGTVASVVRQVERIRRGRAEPLNKDDQVMLRDIIRTGPRSYVRIAFLDRLDERNAGPTVINIGASSEISMEKYMHRFLDDDRGIAERLVDLVSGTIRAFTKNWGPESAFSIRAGVSVCGIRGTNVEIDYVPELDEVTYRVHEGVVEITTPGGKVILQKGETLTVRDGVPVRDAPPA